MKAPLLTLMILGLMSTAAWAHTDDYLDKQITPNGGQMRMSGAYHFELVVAKDSKTAKENPIIVYLTDHADKKVSSAKVTGTATLLAGKTKATATLTADGDNRLKGFAKYASDPNMKVVVSVTFPGKAAEQARFTPLKKRAVDPHAGHGNHHH
jgi:hypothetical protein